MRIRSALIGGCTTLFAFGFAQAQSWETLPSVAPAPADNPTTEAKVELGKALYHDPRFSDTGTIACASCHNLMEGGDDHRPTSIGVHGIVGGRNAPTVWNAAFISSQFWDGRAASLEAQAKGPITNPIEMGMKDLSSAMDRIRAIPGYAPLFAAAFGPGDTMNIDNAAKAIAAFERTLITPGSAYDRYVKGDKKALTEQQQRGMKNFAELGCNSCHSGAAFAGPALPEGTPFLQRFPVNSKSPYIAKYDLIVDNGRSNTTKNPDDDHMWRVPTLRNLVYTAPYLHNGSVKTLPEMAKVMASTQLGKDLTDAQAADIAAFLEGLTGEFPKLTFPRLPPTPGDLLK